MDATGYVKMIAILTILSTTVSYVASADAPVAAACMPPPSPDNGDYLLWNSGGVLFLVFSCDSDYRIIGSKVLRCQTNGQWDSSVPSCEPQTNGFTCGNPGSPKHGWRDGTDFSFRSVIFFYCDNGYERKGAGRIQCQKNGQWSSGVPTCEPCPKDTYMDSIMASEVCTPCPPNAHTASPASTYRTDCKCEEGFLGDPGEPCQEILCATLAVPASVEIISCNNKFKGQCQFRCKPGYIRRGGDTEWECREYGWFPSKVLVCEECPINWYQKDEEFCEQCPWHSHTLGPASQKDGCLCDQGYQGPPGGPCTDVDECVTNGGKGPCQDLCVNQDGSFRCECSTPGYEPDPADHTKCIVDVQCDLTSDMAPPNGGLVCHRFAKENSIACMVKCNVGYEPIGSFNEVYLCGATTGFDWSYRLHDPDSRIPPCVDAFFPDFRFGDDASYFQKSCRSLNDESRQATLGSLLAKLNHWDHCHGKVCLLDETEIVCGQSDN